VSLADGQGCAQRRPRSTGRNITQLRVIPLCESSFLEVHLARGVTFWVPTQTPQPLVTSPGSVSTFLSHYACGLPLGMALSWVVSIPGTRRYTSPPVFN